MAGLLKAIENGYKPTPRDIAEELEEACNVSFYNSWYAKSADTGVIHREEFISKLLKLLFSSNPALLKSCTTGIL